MRVLCLLVVLCGVAHADEVTSETWKFAEAKSKPMFVLARETTESVVASADGKHVVFVENQGAHELRSGAKSTKREQPLVSAQHVVFAKSGEYVALVERAKSIDVGTVLTVVRMSDHAVVISIEGGADPSWVAKSTVAFRVGNQVMRLDLPGKTPKPVGKSLASFGCPNADAALYSHIEAEKTCPSKRFSQVIAIDPKLASVLVVDSGGKDDEVLRLVDLVAGTERVLADGTLGDPLYTSVSPNGMRYCVQPRKNGSFGLYCGRFGDAPEKVLEGEKYLMNPSWLDEDRVLLYHVGLVDLAKKKKIELYDAGIFANLSAMGPRYVLADERVLDLGKRVWFDISDDKGEASRNGRGRIHRAGAGGGRMWVTRSREKEWHLRDVFELRLGR